VARSARVREEQDFGSLRVGHEFTWALGAYASVVPNVLDLALESWGSTAFDRFGDSQVTPIEALGGVRVTPIEGFHIGASAGGGLVRGYGAGDFRAVLSVSYATPGDQGPGDRDGDVVTDDRDRCPDEPEDADGFADADGCPDADNDQDGVPDTDDGCADQPEDRDGLADEDGCPEDDADGDGATDETDRCPTEPGAALAARPECTGCPTCDGHNDAEPEPEPEAQPPESQPESAPETLPQRVYFETGDAGLRPGEIRTLRRVRAYLLAHPSVNVEIEGHADFRGNEPNNLALSQDRAQRVAAWLAGHGIDESRMVLVGCGEAYPAEINDTRAGRRANRRVEFHLVSSSPRVRPGCETR
jgi:outer membrane protein OmpA-like peptidoglycan-associated protein